MSGTHLYRIICRKRSDRIGYAEQGVVYWMPNKAGYTKYRVEAGLYTALELDDCSGNGFDWFAERLTSDEMERI
jgi:hypothetical protein